MALRHRVPTSRMYAPTTMVANGAGEAGFTSDDMFGGGSPSDEPAAEAVAAATSVLASGGSKSEAVEAAKNEGASTAEAKAATEVATVAIRRRGRPSGVPNKPKDAVSVSAANKAQQEPKAPPANLGPLPDRIKGIPSDAYLTTCGRGQCAYSPKKKLKYSLKDGSVMKAAGRPSAEGNVSPAKPATAAAKPASQKPSTEMLKVTHTGGAKLQPQLQLAISQLLKASGFPGLKVELTGAGGHSGSHGGRQAGSKNKPKEGALALKENGAEQANLGPYTMTLLRNPITTFKVAGVPVVPTAVGVAGTVGLKHLIKAAIPHIPMVRDMEEGSMLRELAPYALIGAVAAGVHFWAERAGHELTTESAETMVGLAFAFGVNAAVDKHIEKAVKAVVPAPKDAPKEAPKTALPAPAQTAEKPLTGGRFVERLNGGAWREEALAGYVQQARSSGYPRPQLGSQTGYPPANLAGSPATRAGSVDLARSMSSTLNGGRWNGPAPIGHDMSELKD